MPKKSYHQILDEHLHILIAQGSYDAFIKLRKRYHKHAIKLANELFKQYNYTGISFNELMVACEDHFPYAISKFVPGLSSFYLFWKNHTRNYLITYIIENTYDGDVLSLNNLVFFDQKNEETHSFGELIGETDDEMTIKRKLFEIKHIIHKYGVFFTSLEKTLLNFIMQGYSLTDFENAKVLCRSQINLTYKSAIEKLQKYMGTDK